MRRTIAVEIDGETLRLECTSLTISQHSELLRLGGARGIPPTPLSAAFHRQRVQAFDRYVQVRAGDLLVDGVISTEGLAAHYAAREDVIARLFNAFLIAQQPVLEDIHNLRVAIRFSNWLSDAIDRQSSSHWVKTGTDCSLCQALKLCAKRGCAGTETKRPVWHSGPIILRRCPVLSFTPEIEEAMRLFYWSHSVVVDAGKNVRYRQIHLINPGGVQDQDAWLTGAFGHLRAIHYEIANDRTEH